MMPATMLATAEAVPRAKLADTYCALCGGPLAGRQHYRLISPLVAMGAVVVCGNCRRVALREGYRPA
jgi:hypothetical protein